MLKLAENGALNIKINVKLVFLQLKRILERRLALLEKGRKGSKRLNVSAHQHGFKLEIVYDPVQTYIM
jgi:hypothetical protein